MKPKTARKILANNPEGFEDGLTQQARNELRKAKKQQRQRSKRNRNIRKGRR